MNSRKYGALLFTIICFLEIFSAFGQERLIKPGDAIEIAVYGQDQLSKTVVVKPEGRVDYPALEQIPIDGLTLQRFRDVLISQISRYLDRTPLITVRFAETYPINVTVLGQVSKPGKYEVSSAVNLQSIFAEAGGLTAGAQLSRVKLLRLQGNDSVNQIINLDKFYLEGKIADLPKIQDGDTIVVPGNPLATTVKVLGGVMRPGTYEVALGGSLLDIIYMAGGPADDADLGGIRLFSIAGQNSRELRVDIEDLSDSDKLKTIPMVTPGDVVIVPQKAVTWRKFMNVMRDATLFATLYYLVWRAR